MYFHDIGYVAAVISILFLSMLLVSKLVMICLCLTIWRERVARPRLMGWTGACFGAGLAVPTFSLSLLAAWSALDTYGGDSFLVMALCMISMICGLTLLGISFLLFFISLMPYTPKTQWALPPEVQVETKKPWDD